MKESAKSSVYRAMEVIVQFARENAGILFFLGFFGVYLALQLWILPAMGVPT